MPHPPQPSRRRFLKGGLALASLSGTRAFATPEPPPASAAADPDLAFFVISDTHYLAPAEDPSALDPHILAVNRRAIDVLNNLPGQPLPDGLGGGTVKPARGVIHLGDMIDSGDKGSSDLNKLRQQTEWQAYTDDFGLAADEGRLKLPIYEVHGNHDSVRETNVVISSMIERNRSRPGISHISSSGLHYSWDWAGIHFIALGIVVGHNDQDLPIGRYKAHDSLQFLAKDLAEKVGDSARPVVLLHHIDLLRYSKECGPDSEKGGEWSACDVAAYHQAIQPYNVAAIFHGHLHGRRTDHWDGTPTSAAPGEGIPVFGCSNTGAGGGNRGLFYCCVEDDKLVVREYASLRTPDGWAEGTASWTGAWEVPLHPST